MKEEKTKQLPETTIDGAQEEYGEGFPEPDVFTSAEEAKASAEDDQAAERERAAAVAVIAGMTGALCNIAIARLDGASPVTEAESLALADRIYALAEYYDVQLSEVWGLWLGLGMTSVAIFAPRIAEAKEHAERKAQLGRQNSASDRSEGIRQDDQAPEPATRGGETVSDSPGLYT